MQARYRHRCQPTPAQQQALARSFGCARLVFNRICGKEFRVTDRGIRVPRLGDPTSQRGSACGQLGGKKHLNIRDWTCLHCDAEHDRDINAAHNIAAAGQVEAQNGPGAKHQTGSPAAGCEAPTQQGSKQL